MSKFNSRSFNVGNYEDDVLKQHISMLMELSQEIVNDKLQQQQEKQRRIEAVQQRFVSWADKKQAQLKEKMEKCTKLKEEHINKIVKKCQDNDKYLGQKLKNHQKKNKESLREAWKMNQKYKSELEDFQSKMSKSKSINNTRSLGQSQLNYRKKASLEKRRQFQTSAFGTESFIHKQNMKKRQIQDEHTKLKSRTSQPIHFLTEGDEQQQRQVKKFQQKLQQAFSRFKHNLAEEQQSKIQQLGQRLQKIEKGRNRKVEFIKKKRQRYHHFNENSRHERRQGKVDKSQRIRSQSVIKEKRVHDWSEANKHKREEFFQSHLQAGNNYLENSKLKFLKTSIAKKIALSTIEKKLYLQRLKH